MNINDKTTVETPITPLKAVKAQRSKSVTPEVKPVTPEREIKSVMRKVTPKLTPKRFPPVRTRLANEEIAPEMQGAVLGKDKKFLLAAKSILITYPGHLDKEEVVKFFNQPTFGKAKNPGNPVVEIAHEYGKSRTYPHTHVVVGWKTLMRTSDCRAFDWEGPRMVAVENGKMILRNEASQERYEHLVDLRGRSTKEEEELDRLQTELDRKGVIETVLTHEGVHGDVQPGTMIGSPKWKAWLNYLTKEDPDNKDIVTFVSAEAEMKALSKCKTSYEAVSCFAQDEKGRLDKKSVTGVIAAYGTTAGIEKEKLQRKRRTKKLELLALLPWQSWLDRMMNLSDKGAEPNDRKVHNIVDLKGNCGKTVFASWLRWRYPEQVVRASGQTGDQMRYAIVEAADKAGVLYHENTVIIFDMSRSDSKYQMMNQVMTVVEEIKNGDLKHTKWKGNDMETWCPWVIIYSNRWLKYDMLSEDRWGKNPDGTNDPTIFELVMEDGVAKPVPVTYGQGIIEYKKQATAIKVELKAQARKYGREADRRLEMEFDAEEDGEEYVPEYDGGLSYCE